jgi:hypothetical protein
MSSPLSFGAAAYGEGKAVVRYPIAALPRTCPTAKALHL